ncbi:hypothetical protein AAHH78_38525, partial [Burkholderia pseudomallei]
TSTERIARSTRIHPTRTPASTRPNTYCIKRTASPRLPPIPPNTQTGTEQSITKPNNHIQYTIYPKSTKQNTKA